MGASINSWSDDLRRGGILLVSVIIAVLISVVIVKYSNIIPEVPAGDKTMEQAITYLVNLETGNPELAGKIEAKLKEKIEGDGSLPYLIGRSLAYGFLDVAEEKLIQAARCLDYRYTNDNKIRSDGIGKKDELTKAVERFVVLVRKGPVPEILPEDVLEIELEAKEPEPADESKTSEGGEE